VVVTHPIGEDFALHGLSVAFMSRAIAPARRPNAGGNCRSDTRAAHGRTVLVRRLGIHPMAGPTHADPRGFGVIVLTGLELLAVAGALGRQGGLQIAGSQSPLFFNAASGRTGNALGTVGGELFFTHQMSLPGGEKTSL